MEERNQLDNRDWYRPMDQTLPSQEGTDIFEEAGVYQMKSRRELYEQNKPKRGRGLIIGLVATALLVGAIALTAKLFAEDEPAGNIPSMDDYYDIYGEYFQSDEITGENTIPRAPTAPDVALTLGSNADRPALTLQELYAKCLPSVVGVRTWLKDAEYSWGTGVVMTADGYIITNTHVLDGADAVQILLHDGAVLDAKLVGCDAISDVAVLKVEAKGLTPAEFCDSDLVLVGDAAIAIGNPLGEQFSGTMSTGIISGLSRSVSVDGRTMSLLQTDAALNHGNSGGALFNIQGQVIGITNMKQMTSYTNVVEGIGFAIPTVTVKEMVDAILDDGAVVGRPGLGIMVYDLNGPGEDYPDGMLVSSVTPGSDAEKQGLQPDDIITEIDGQPADSIEALRGAINKKRVGDKVTVKVWRDGEELELKIKLIDQNDAK